MDVVITLGPDSQGLTDSVFAIVLEVEGSYVSLRVWED